jgi:hypothetical protein
MCLKTEMVDLLEGSPQVVCLSLSLLGADSLINSLIDERNGVAVVGGLQGIESQR